MFHTLVWNRFPEHRRKCFHPNNEGKKTPMQATQDRTKGVVAGVSDYICLIPRNGYPFLCLEFKLPGQKQREEQIHFQRQVESEGGLYVLVYNHHQAWDVFTNYLGVQMPLDVS